MVTQDYAQTLSFSPIEKNHDTLSFNGSHNKAIAWLIKYPLIDWQIRNATGHIKGEQLTITAQDSEYHHCKTVIITPTNKRDFYLNKTIHVSAFAIQYLNDKHISITLTQFNHNHELVFYSASPIKTLSGAQLLGSHDSGFRLKPTNKSVEVVVK